MASAHSTNVYSLLPEIPEVVVGAVKTRLSPLERKLRRGDVIFSQSYWMDFKFYLENNHILLAICCTHREHVNNSFARIIAFITSNLFAVCLACISSTADESNKLILDYFVWVVVQTIFDLNIQYINTCECARGDGVPVRYHNSRALHLFE